MSWAMRTLTSFVFHAAAATADGHGQTSLEGGVTDLRTLAAEAQAEASRLREEAAAFADEARRRRAELAVAAANAKTAEAVFLTADQALRTAESDAAAAADRRDAAAAAARRALAALVLTSRETPLPAIFGRADAAAEAAQAGLAVGLGFEKRRETLEAHRTAARAAMAAEVEARRVREERAGALEVRRERIAAIDALLNTAATSADRALSEANAAQDRAARAAEEARSLEDLADRLTDPQRPGSGVPRLKTWALRELALANARPGLKPGRSRAPTLAGLPAPRRGLASPIVGGVRSTFDDAQAADADLPGRGLVFVGAPGAEVSAPADAAVVFARRYLRYGRVLILDLGGGDQLVMIGCERLYVRAGEVVRRGQAIGRLPSNGQMRLYLEIRRQRRSVDPSPWFDAKTASANG